MSRQETGKITASDIPVAAGCHSAMRMKTPPRFEGSGCGRRDGKQSDGEGTGGCGTMEPRPDFKSPDASSVSGGRPDVQDVTRGDDRRRKLLPRDGSGGQRGWRDQWLRGRGGHAPNG